MSVCVAWGWIFRIEPNPEPLTLNPDITITITIAIAIANLAPPPRDTTWPESYRLVPLNGSSSRALFLHHISMLRIITTCAILGEGLLCRQITDPLCCVCMRVVLNGTIDEHP